MEIFRTVLLGVVALTLLISAGAGALVAGQRISAWEKANGYPYGKLCDVFRNCR